MWTELDAYPGFETKTDKWFEYPSERLKQISPYFINGMIYGWNFSYTPSDKMRNVQEFFEVTDINTVNFTENPIRYSEIQIDEEENRIKAWIEFDRTAQMIWNLKPWNSIKSQKIHGRGKARLSLGFDGIKAAAEDSLKNAVRDHYSKIIKNKPKEIDGKVIIRSTPQIGIDAGFYVVELDFFVETDRIISYIQF